MKVEGIKTWKEHTIGVQRLAGLLFNNDLINTTCPLRKFLATKVVLSSEMGSIYLFFLKIVIRY